MTPGVRTMYVVTRAGLEATNSGDWLPLLQTQINYQPLTDDDRGEYRVPEAAFANRAEALAEARRRELAARELLNPFTLEWGDLQSLSSLSAAELRAALSARGVATPTPVSGLYEDVRSLAHWWETESANWTVALRAELWELFDKVKLYDVQEVPFE
jgi:hypothetical protein